jgi:hypothetical protein
MVNYPGMGPRLTTSKYFMVSAVVEKRRWERRGKR